MIRTRERRRKEGERRGIILRVKYIIEGETKIFHQQARERKE